jgi:ppGpp synthetase/RelA/SpoT-type nucleotidyltranferase
MIDDELKKLYKYRYENVLTLIANRLESSIRELIKDYPRIDRVSARAKSPNRFLSKAGKIENNHPKYTEPLSQIQDQIGVRIITFYLSDIEPLSRVIESYFAPIEERIIVPDSVNEFGYEGKHYVLFIPKELLTPDLPEEHCPVFFELQIKTLFEHAWAEANHDLAYKPQSKLDAEHRRRVAFTAAQAWGADFVFNQLVTELGVVQ